MEQTLENILMNCLPLFELECRLSRYGQGHIFAVIMKYQSYKIYSSPYYNLTIPLTMKVLSVICVNMYDHIS